MIPLAITGMHEGSYELAFAVWLNGNDWCRISLIVLVVVVLVVTSFARKDW